MIRVTIKPTAFTEQSIVDAVERAKNNDRSEIERLKALNLKLSLLRSELRNFRVRLKG